MHLDLKELRRLRKRKRRLLAVFAHPADESYGCAGALARAGADPGAATVLVCLTSGEASTVLAARGLVPEEIRDLREDRMARVKRRLGVDLLILPRLPDGRLAREPLHAVGGLVRSVARTLAPQVVISQDARGVNGHPDHVAAHWAVRYAFEGEGARGPDALAPRHAAVVYGPEVAEMVRPRLIFPTADEEIDVVLRLTEAEIHAKEECLAVHEAVVTLRELGKEDGTRTYRPPIETYDLLGEDHTPPLDDLFA
jgi:LmbE family N-acetylglucosaminyl deacetylase